MLLKSSAPSLPLLPLFTCADAFAQAVATTAARRIFSFIIFLSPSLAKNTPHWAVLRKENPRPNGA